MRSVIQKIVEHWLENDYIEKDEKEFYCFTLESIFVRMINYVTVIVFALALKRIVDTFFFVFLLKLLRGNMGGIHMGKWYECYIVSNVLILLAVGSSTMFVISVVMLMSIYVACLFVVYKYAPFIHPNNPISQEREKQYRLKTIIICIVVVVITLVFKYVGYEKYVTLCFYSMTASSIMLLLGNIKNRERRLKYENNS